MKIVYIILLNISENFEGNVNFENLKGRSNDAICFKTFGVHVFVAIYHYYDYIFLMKMMPGSPFNDAKLGAEQKAILNEKYGLNDPVAIQYLHYLKNVVTGDFGYSFQYHNQPVWELIKPRLIPSMEMGIIAMIIGVFLGLILGIAAATKQNTWVDYTTTVISVIAVSVPSFVLAVLLQYVFAVRLRWFPVAGWEGISTAVLPSLALSAGVMATVARYIRAEMIEVLSSDYILLARAKGIHPCVYYLDMH